MLAKLKEPPMSCTTDAGEWVESTGQVVIIERCLRADNIDTAVIPPIQKLLVGNGEAGEGFCCDECLALFQDQSDSFKAGGPSFILDFPTSVGVPERALFTLPYGLTVGRSGIPGAGVGVINHGPPLAPGMHFGPFEGGETSVENAIASDFSWEIYKGQDVYEYIDASSETLSNWMRYVNRARSRDESNLLAVQYKGSILYHCCRSVHAGDELLVWPSGKLLARFSDAWTQMWLTKLESAAESISPAASQVFVCVQCKLTFTTEAFLQRHADCFHSNRQLKSNPDETEAENLTADAEVSTPALTLLPDDAITSIACSDCGRTFKKAWHLKRHKLCVHGNRRPYCCPLCRRSFSQASAFIRHQVVHRKPGGTNVAENTERVDGSQKGASNTSDVTTSEELSDAKDRIASEAAEQEADKQPHVCSECGKSFCNQMSLKKHKMLVHDMFRPYVCTVCKRCFGQYSDLTRHLQRHRTRCKGRPRACRLSGVAAKMSFSCAECSLAFSTVDLLQLHIGTSHSEQSREGSDPNSVPQPSEAPVTRLSCVRPRRHVSKSKISPIIQLVAPKRKESTDSSDKLLKHKCFRCNHCNQSYANPDELRVHKCNQQRHVCTHCGTTFDKSVFLRRHEQTVHRSTPLCRCEHCGKVFVESGGLKQHQHTNACRKYHCATELFSCAHCQFSFTTKSFLTKHVRRHHPAEYLADSPTDQPEVEQDAKVFTCPHCDEGYTSAKAFKSHSCSLQVKVLYFCTDCGKGFGNHYTLKQHQRTHTGEKPYCCPHCAKGFAHSGQLTVHLRTHTGEKPYLCTHCGESFRQSGDLKRHERKHTGVRPYACEQCCKSFSRLQSLKAHRMLHMGQRIFTCGLCEKSFSRNYHLRRHHRKNHT
ncbi:histone-lysine N-methyltransferase PRDM9 isoform X1 [Phyllopteryx taeniolatus]|uniref:histone-lysine N-methyltransferase PRDM9 isoform X1 n=1 Tax=Phyllopteryx taeniolatus TaxID=161469 RepID=UPI002AD3FF7E|nr:histone-lysine N-methyltransferase PRDM9 isoform X1 [Phyllopteryx taeniolatus]